MYAINNSVYIILSSIIIKLHGFQYNLITILGGLVLEPNINNCERHCRAIIYLLSTIRLSKFLSYTWNNQNTIHITLNILKNTYQNFVIVFRKLF